MTKKGSESRSIKDSLSSLFKFNQDMFLGNTQTILQINSVLIPLAENYVGYLQQQDWKSIKNMPYESLKQYFDLANVLFEQQRVIKDGITDDTAKAATCYSNCLFHDKVFLEKDLAPFVSSSQPNVFHF